VLQLQLRLHALAARVNKAAASEHLPDLHLQKGNSGVRRVV
jgi:hypothetical protein